MKTIGNIAHPDVTWEGKHEELYTFINGVELEDDLTAVVVKVG